MRIVIVEIMPHGHYTLVDSVSRIYASDKNNEVIIITQDEGTEVLLPVLKGLSNVSFDEFSAASINQQLIRRLEFLNPDKIYIITLEKYFNLFCSLKTKAQISLFIHNIDYWFQISLKNNIIRFFNACRSGQKLVYAFKRCFLYPYWQKRLLKYLNKDNSRLVVLNQVLKEELKLYFPPDKIDVIPFSVYNQEIKDKSDPKGLIRICVPGMLSAIRRDYDALFRILEEDLSIFKNNIELDLLGGVAKQEDGDRLIKLADKLIAKGMKINYYNKPLVHLAEFDEELSKAHIVLGNMNVILTKSSSYGKTKDSGIIYTLIHAAKPGLLPFSYPVMQEMKSSIVLFNDYNHLKIIILGFINDKNKLSELAKQARRNSLHFEPSAILKRLIQQVD